MPNSDMNNVIMKFIKQEGDETHSFSNKIDALVYVRQKNKDYAKKYHDENDVDMLKSVRCNIDKLNTMIRMEMMKGTI